MWQGKVRDIRIYNRVLSSQEIAEHYLASRRKYHRWYDRFLYLWLRVIRRQKILAGVVEK